MPKNLWHALTWYAERTNFWSSNDEADHAYNELIVGFIKSCMEAEATDPLLAIEWLKYVLGDEYELHPSIPMN